MSYNVDFTPQALEDISKLDTVVAERVIKKFDWLSQHFEVITPQPLKGRFQGVYKLVVGDWRVIYTADYANQILTVHLVRHRREVYK